MLVLKNVSRTVFFLLLLVSGPSCAYCEDDSNTGVEVYQSGLKQKDIVKSCKSSTKTLSYFLYVEDFISSVIEIPTANVEPDSTTISSAYYAGIAPLYNTLGEKVGICSASFLCMQTPDGIYTDISNYISVDNGLIITWFTPTTLINLELDSIIHSMVTECIVLASTKVGFNPFYGKEFNMIVSSDDSKIYFQLTRI